MIIFVKEIDDKEEGEDENDENEDASDNNLDDMDTNDATVLGKGSVDEDDSDYDDEENISKNEFKDRLHRSGNNLKMFELDLFADKALSNIEFPSSEVFSM